MCLCPPGRAHRTVNDAVDAKLRDVVPLISENREQRRESCFGDRIAAPVGLGLLAPRVQGKHDAGIGSRSQQRKERARHAEWSKQIYTQCRMPLVESLVLDGTQRTKLHRGVNQRVKASVLRLA